MRTVTDVVNLVSGREIWWMKLSNWVFVIDGVVIKGTLDQVYEEVVYLSKIKVK